MLARLAFLWDMPYRTGNAKEESANSEEERSDEQNQ